MSVVELERVEAAACADLHRAAPPELAERYGIRAVEVAGATCRAVAALPGVRMLNHVVGLGVGAPAPEGAIDEIDAFYRSAGCRYAVGLSPEARPHDLPARLRARGFAADLAWVKFARAVQPPPPVRTDLAIAAVEPTWASDFGRVVMEGFGLPDWAGEWIAGVVGRPRWTCYVAWDGDAPVAAAALYAADAVAWLGLGATLPEQRGRGAQGALIARRVARAGELGCALVVTETGAPVEGRPGPSYRNILRSGFSARYQRPNWRSPGR
ncbi:MAG TPA: hypothetical protein VKD47_02860 [Miltoncostaeaceae bacterium]|nr:hypothetical protein [Miltoncostaeaceae bacterium]